MIFSIINSTRRVYDRIFTRSGTDTLIISSSYLALSTLVNSGLGYIYWIVAAHLFSSETVGASAALISILNLIATVAPMGLDSSLVYILARSKDRWARKVFSFGLAIVAVTILLAALFLPFVDALNKNTTSVGASFEGGLVFILTCLLWTFSLVIDELFTVEEITGLVLVRNGLTSVLKLVFLPLALLFAAGQVPLLILAGWGLGALVAIGLTAVIFAWKKHSQRSFKPELDLGLVRQNLGVSLGNYSIIMTQQIPALILPVIITQTLSAQYNAYFYTIFMFVQGVLLTIPLAISQTFFVQTADTDPASLRAKMTSLLSVTLVSMVPLIAASILFRTQILGLFGSEYVSNGSTLLVIMSFGALPAAFIRLYVSLQRIQGDFGRGLVATVGGLIAIVGGTFLFIPIFGLAGVGLGWTAGLTLISLLLGIDLLFFYHRAARTTGPEKALVAATQPAPLPTLDEAVLNKVFQQMVGAKFEIFDWRLTPLQNNLVNPVSGGTFRVCGTGLVDGLPVTRPVVLKILKSKGQGDNPHDWNYWKREALAYRSGFLDRLPAGLNAPRCYGVTEKPESKEIWLWLEDVSGLNGLAWPPERYASVARDLGLFNGAYLTGQPLPYFPWLSKRRSLTWVEGAIPSAPHGADWLLLKLGNTRLRAGLARWLPGLLNFSAEILFRHNLRRFLQKTTWANPLVRQAFPVPIDDRLLQLWKNRQQLLDILEKLPRTLCHLDAWNPNLFSGQGQPRTTAIDWEFVGQGAVGEELVQLIWCNLYYFNLDLAEAASLEQAIYENYLAGLKAAGWHGDPRLVRLGYTASAALRWGLSAPGLGLALDETRYLAEAQRWHRPVAEILRQRAGMAYLLLDRADEALRLAGELALTKKAER